MPIATWITCCKTLFITLALFSRAAESTLSMENFVQDFQSAPITVSIAVGAISLLIFIARFISTRKSRSSALPPVPVVPGLPIIGNLLQLKEKKPHKTFKRWAETYGPIYSIRTGAATLVVLNTADVAKEAMVTRFSSISTRKLSNALKILTFDKRMVAMSDYDDFHKLSKRLILTNLLGTNAQKRLRSIRNDMIENITRHFHASVEADPMKAVNFREVFEHELLRLALKQSLGWDIESIYVEELGATFSKHDMHKVFVVDMMEGAIDVDWRDFFPYLKWIPNKSFETRNNKKHNRRLALINALIKEYQKRSESGEELNGYVKVLLAESNNLTKDQIATLLWETIIETSDTTLVSTEWGIYELAKNPEKQERLYREIQKVCGSEKIKEENVSQLPYLSAIFQETLRKHNPVPVIPLRYVHEDTQIGGYHVPAGTEIAINIYGCNLDKKRWEAPEQWNPERFLDEKYDPADLYKTMAFGAGKRICAGSLFAMTVFCASIGRLVQEFEWKLKDGEEENVDTFGLTSQKLHPVYAIIKPRN